MIESANKMKQRVIGMMIKRNVVDPLLEGRCGLREEELMVLAHAYCHIEKNIEETCQILNYCDPKTLKRWEEDPDLDFPKHHKDCGGKHYYWLDEIEIWREAHPEILARVDQKRKHKH